MDIEEIRAFRNLHTIVEATEGHGIQIFQEAGQFVIKANGFAGAGDNLIIAIEDLIKTFLMMGNPGKATETH